MGSQRQTSLYSFFKTTGAISRPVLVNKMDNKNKLKRRSLSLIRSPRPIKSPKTLSQQCCELKTEAEIISLSSDEDQLTPSKRQRPEDSRSNSTSQRSTQSINASTSSPNTSTDSDATIFLSPSIYQMPTTTPTKTTSPGSSKKYFSPIKKRVVQKRSPAKRNLSSQFQEINNQPDSSQKEVKSSYFRDDKTLFLISLIDKYLQNDALKDLLEEDAQVLLSNCMRVVEPGMRVVCRLFWRQSGWYRTEQLEQIASGKEKVSKDNISSLNMREMFQSLLDNQLIVSTQYEDTSMQFEDYVKLLKRDELLKICQEFKIKVKSKQDAAEELRKFSQCRTIRTYFGQLSQKSNNKTRLLERLQSSLGQCYKLSDTLRNTLSKLYLLMYLGIDYTIIREKKLELVLINDKINRESYPIDKNMKLDDASIVFKTKEDFNRYYEAHLMYEQYIIATENKHNITACDLVLEAYKRYKEIDEQEMLRYKSLPSWLRRFTPANIYIKIMESGVQELKKDKSEGKYLVAVDILDSLIAQIAFRQHKRPHWYEEKTLILHKHLKNAEQAAKTILEAFKADLSQEAKDSLRQRSLKMADQGNITLDDDLRQALRDCTKGDHILENKMPADHVHKTPMDNSNQKGKLKFSAYTDEGRTILNAEEYCILYYRQNGQYTHGEHCEGRIVATIFFLLFWDIIYTKPVGISGIFMSYYQRHPLDMYSESFYINRKTLIDDRLVFIEESTDEILVEIMQDKWNSRPESDVSDISRHVSLDALSQVCRALGPRAVAAICRRFARNYGYTHSGFPDLTLWNVHTKQIKFVEVKTDADKPSMKQLQWLDYLISHNIPAGFCYLGVNTTRSKARARDTHSSS